MSTWGLSAIGRLPHRAWRRFHIWRAKRMDARVIAMEAEAKRLKAKADMLLRRHAEDPQRRLPLGDD
jgi:hypothetical protein